MNKEEIIVGMERIMEIALHYANPFLPDYEDWGAVSSIAEVIYNELKESEDNEQTRID